MRESALEGISFCLVLGLAASADGLADRSGGMVALLVGVILSGVPLLLARLGGTSCRRRRARGPHKTGKPARAGGFWAKRKPLRW